MDMQKSAAMSASLAKNWWLIVVRGVLAIVFGLVAIFLPGATMLSLVLVYAGYTLAHGIAGIAAGVRSASHHHRWGWFILEGVANIGAAAIALFWPGLTLLIFVVVVGVWAAASGVFMIIASFRLHATHGRVWLAIGGIVSVLYGALLLIAPMLGILVVVWWLGAYALAFGVSLLIVGIKLRPHAK
jgi:uncharacterized membrane protein HdeD (DUF308 family)